MTATHQCKQLASSMSDEGSSPAARFLGMGLDGVGSQGAGLPGSHLIGRGFRHLQVASIVNGEINITVQSRCNTNSSLGLVLV